MWDLDCEESWAPKNRCFWTVVLEKTLESPLDCKKIQPDHPKWDKSWVFIARTDVAAETPILWPPHAKCWLIRKYSDAGRDCGKERRGDRGWDDWMASPTRWTWIWVISGSMWWTGRPGMLRFMGSQKVGHDWTTELNWIERWFRPDSKYTFCFSSTINKSIGLIGCILNFFVRSILYTLKKLRICFKTKVWDSIITNV